METLLCWPMRSRISAPWMETNGYVEVGAFFLHQMLLLWHKTDWQECKINSVSPSLNFEYLFEEFSSEIGDKSSVVV